MMSIVERIVGRKPLPLALRSLLRMVLGQSSLQKSAFLTTSPKKERIEVRWSDLSAEDKAKFSAAKDKELKAWLDHGTVKRVAAGTLQPE